MAALVLAGPLGGRHDQIALAAELVDGQPVLMRVIAEENDKQLLVVGQVALAWRCVVRGARYAAALQVSSQLVRPLARPDPWRKSIGGPGGPRYPIGGDEADEYGVSL